MLNRIKQLFNKEKPAQHEVEVEVLNPCCDQPLVHVAYRGKSDDRLYMAYDRNWQEVQFFSPNGLRVFCKQCRRRVY